MHEPAIASTAATNLEIHAHVAIAIAIPVISSPHPPALPRASALPPSSLLPSRFWTQERSEQGVHIVDRFAGREVLELAENGQHLLILLRLQQLSILRVDLDI